MAGTKIQLKDINLKPYLTSGTLTEYVLDIERVSAYNDGEVYFVDFHLECGDQPTLEINGLGAKPITDGGVAISAGVLVEGSGYFVKYSSNSDSFLVVGGGGGGGGSCSNIKDCIENFTSLDLSNLENLILGGPNTEIIIDGSTLIFDGGSVEYNNTEIEYNDSNISYENTIIEGGTYEDIVIVNPTIVGGTVGAVFWFNESPIAGGMIGDEIELSYSPLGSVVMSVLGGVISVEPDDYELTNNKIRLNKDFSSYTLLVSYITSQVMVDTELATEYFQGDVANTVFPLADEPQGQIMVSIKGGVIQVSPGDYEFNVGEQEFKMLIDTTGLEIIVSYIKDVGYQQSKQSDRLETDPLAASYIKNKPSLVDIAPVIVNSAVYNANNGEYLIIKHLGNVTINLPVVEDGKQIRIKKFTGEDSYQTTIVPAGQSKIDGYDEATMNINRTMYTFTGIDGDWYLGD